VDCLLQAGAARVHAVEPGYGVLDYGLRQDPRVCVHERTNALRFACPEPCDLVTIDVGWTPQRLILPAAGRCLNPTGLVISLVKPQYEADATRLERGVVPEGMLPDVLAGCRQDVQSLGWVISGECESPLRGHGGNREYCWMLAPGPAHR
jgi:23S rRNA (cytidine1920-2'-O)/16S rRNA (cytidine1409-2'-O)-methyltransferase